MRQFSGFASPEETNERYKYLLASGSGSLSVAFDRPTLMGYDSDYMAKQTSEEKGAEDSEWLEGSWEDP
jgi:methylmalonyl-CoA mutase N-terminal domain/subunit